MVDAVRIEEGPSVLRPLTQAERNEQLMTIPQSGRVYIRQHAILLATNAATSLDQSRDIEDQHSVTQCADVTQLTGQSNNDH